MEASEKKRVLLVSCDGLGNGGVQAVMMSIVRSLSGSCLFDALLFTEEIRHYDREFQSFGGTIHRIPKYEGSSGLMRKLDRYVRGPRLYRALLKLFAEQPAYDAVHCNNAFEGALVLKAAKKAGVPIRIMHSHTRGFGGNIIADAMDSHRRRMINKYATVRIGCSAEACKALYGSDKNTLVIPNAYDEKRFDRKRFDDSGPHPLKMVQIGSFNPTKNQLFSVKVLDELVKLEPEARLVFIGFPMGDYKEKVKSAAERMGLLERVDMLEGDADSPAVMSSSACLLLPSLNEGFGIVLAEAQAMGLRCYASEGVPGAADRGGVSYIPLEEGAEGWAKRIAADHKLYRGVHGNWDVSDLASDAISARYAAIYGVKGS